MKKAGSLWLVLLLLVSTMMLSAQAVSSNTQKIEVEHTEFGGFEIETTTIIYDPVARSNSRSADKIYEVKYSGNVIARITLSATFGYDGNTAWVSDASVSRTTYDGWSYGGEKITKSGGVATLNATLSHSQYRNVAINTSLTCSPTGQIS